MWAKNLQSYRYRRTNDFRLTEIGNDEVLEDLQDSLRIRIKLDGGMMNLGELRGLLLWVYFMGISTAWPRSGKPGWPIVGGEACGPSGGPVAVDRE